MENTKVQDVREIEHLCWICGGEAKSSEHMVQAAELKSLLGEPTQQNPIYFKKSNSRSIPLGSTKADRTKFQKKICITCNTARTQPYDLTWHHVSETLRFNPQRLKIGERVYFADLFVKKSAYRNRLNVHLFFLKKFGCHLAEHDVVNLPIEQFASCILNDRAHPNVLLKFGVTPKTPEMIDNEMAANTNLQILSYKETGRCAMAVWAYIVGDLTVHIMFVSDDEKRKGMIDAWHPSGFMKTSPSFLKISDFGQTDQICKLQNRI